MKTRAKLYKITISEIDIPIAIHEYYEFLDNLELNCVIVCPDESNISSVVLNAFNKSDECILQFDEENEKYKVEIKEMKVRISSSNDLKKINIVLRVVDTL